ncbi:MAG: hypothetical protein MMC33_002611 [Icmadophila ericetorum]|nr:hypothetical protein [Icmadophila ericetorum]
MGTRNFVREINFEGGTRWAAKDHMRHEISNIDEDDGLQEELLSTEWVARKTGLPVPTLHPIVTLETSYGEYRCLLMDLIPSADGEKFFSCVTPTSPNLLDQLNEGKENVLRWMARIQLELACIQSPIGGPVTSPSPSYYIHEIQTQKRHFTSQDYGGSPEAAKWSLEVLRVFQSFLPLICEEKLRFYASYSDLGGRNCIFDWFGNLQALIDLDSVRYVPITKAVQLPRDVGLKFALADDGEPKDPHRVSLDHYTEIIREVGEEMDESELAEYFASQMSGYGANAALGYHVADMEYENLCKEWLECPAIIALQYQLTNANEWGVSSEESIQESLTTHTRGGVVLRC